MLDHAELDGADFIRSLIRNANIEGPKTDGAIEFAL